VFASSQPETSLREFRKPMHFSLSADRGWAQRFQLAMTDLKDGMRLSRLIWTLGLSDIKLRYRGSALGPFWLTISMGVQVSAMAFLYADLFHTDIRTYLPYLTISIVLWGYMNSLISEGCTCFSMSESLIKGTRMPFTVHAARAVVRNTIILAHNLVVVVVVFAVMGVHQSLYSLAAIPAFALWVIDGFAISLLFGAFCARFRDVPQIIASIMQIAFFVTPIMWYAKLLENRPGIAGNLIRFNPFFYLLEILRAPLLGTPLTMYWVLKAVLVSAVILGVSAVGFARARGRIAYWV
jgi:lipopolysaccharide transport system permease protein